MAAVRDLLALPVDDLDLVTPEELTGYLKVDERWIEKHITQIPGRVKVGRYWRFQRTALVLALLKGALLTPVEKPQAGRGRRGADQ